MRLGLVATAAVLLACSPKEKQTGRVDASPVSPGAEVVGFEPGPDATGTDTFTDLGEPAPDVPVVTLVAPEPGEAGVCTTRAVVGCGGHAEGYYEGLTSQIDEWGCALAPFDADGVPEHSVALWNPTPAVATLRVSADWTPNDSLVARLLGATDAGCNPASCRAFWTETRMSLAAGEIRYVVLESWLAEAGDWALDVSCCTPQCDQRECGDDGCGGDCGSCAPGSSCDQGHCTDCVLPACGCAPECDGRQCGPDGCGGTCATCAPGTVCDSSGLCRAPQGSANESCSTAKVIAALPFEAIGTTEGPVTDDVNAIDDATGTMVALPGCVRSAEGGKDVVYKYVAAAMGTVTARLDALELGPCGQDGSPPCPPALLYALAGCGSEECLVAGDFLSTGSPPLRIGLAKGQTVYWVVDGYDATEAGPFRFTLVGD